MFELNKIYNVDVYAAIKEIPDATFDCVYTDFPYLIERTIGGGLMKNRTKDTDYLNQINNSGLNKGINESILAELIRVCKKEHIIWLWCNKPQLYGYLKYFYADRGYNYEIMFYGKTNPPPLCGTHFVKDKEYCLCFWKNKSLNIKFNDGKTFYISTTNRTDKKLYKCPTIKPLPFVEQHLRSCLKSGDSVFDPMIGSGTTCVAAKKLGINFLGFELDKSVFNIANTRLNIDKNIF